jgi:hypothetical protein
MGAAGTVISTQRHSHPGFRVRDSELQTERNLAQDPVACSDFSISKGERQHSPFVIAQRLGGF